MMTDKEQREFALREADRYRIWASQLQQIGAVEYARFLRKNADAAMKWAARKTVLAVKGRRKA